MPHRLKARGAGFAGALDHYAQVVTELSEAAAATMGARFLGATPRDERAMEAGSGSERDSPRTRREGL